MNVDKPIAVLTSCKTIEQLQVAKRYVRLWRDRNDSIEERRRGSKWALAFARMRRLIRMEQKRRFKPI